LPIWAGDYTGELWFDDLSVPENVYAAVPGQAERVDLNRLLPLLPVRKRSSHKGDFGHVLIIGGEEGFGGAAMLAAEAALFAGAGLVSCATRSGHITAGLARQPDIMYRNAEQRATLQEMIGKADVLVLGPGLGNQPWGQMCFQAGLESGRPLVVDADGLNQLARAKQTSSASLNLPLQSVITPHPGEAARLLSCDLAEVTRDRFSAVQDLSKQFACTALLKGFGTVISSLQPSHPDSEPQASNLTMTTVLYGHGNPGMAKAGMGDVLAGITGALLAQGLSGFESAQLGACWHAAAADLLLQQCGERSLSASGLAKVLGKVLVATE
jgi:NAD(P)H-hydrate epimerase